MAQYNDCQDYANHIVPETEVGVWTLVAEQDYVAGYDSYQHQY